MRASSDRAGRQRCTVSHLATGHSSWLFEMITRSQCQAVLMLGTQTEEQERLHFSDSQSPRCIKKLRRKRSKKTCHLPGLTVWVNKCNSLFFFQYTVGERSAYLPTACVLIVLQLSATSSFLKFTGHHSSTLSPSLEEH